jgi:hypothetical protein
MKVAKNLAWMVFGYLVAVLVATLVTVALILVFSAFPDGGRFGSFYTVAKDVASFIYVGLLITVSYAFPGWLISVIIAAYRSISDKRYFIIAGALTALLAHLILAGLSGGGPMFNMTGEPSSVVCSVIGGLCGGWAYWRVAMVRFGRWRSLQ